MAYFRVLKFFMGLPGGLVVKSLPASAWDTREVGLIPGSGRAPGGGNGNPPQYACRENSMVGTIHVVTESDMTEHTHTEFFI